MSDIGHVVVGQWYLREDSGEKFLVTEYDEDSGTVEIQTADGDLDELDEEAWESLPLALTEPPQDWTESPDDPVPEDPEGTGVDPLEGQTMAGASESWLDASPLDEIDRLTDKVVPLDFES